ncbi:MAG TPA: phosphoribosyltransferase [Candidatus Saccharimonadales bacterium]|nr:phosphoribosyltransferase [Candidatus Saccharimonadales bacterium]
MTYPGNLLYADRAEAGRVLASRLSGFLGNPDAIVLALPRGGVPVGFEISRQLRLPLDLLIVRKLGVPGQEELAMGAIASGNVLVLNRDVIRKLRIADETIQQVIARERIQVARQEQQFRAGPIAEVRNRTLILVDDGLATGSTMRAAAQTMRTHCPRSLIVAVPVGPVETCAQLRQEADQVLCVATPSPFGSVGAFYHIFNQTTDEEVRALLERSRDSSSEIRQSA